MGPEASPAHGRGASRTQHKLEEEQSQERGEAGRPEATGCAGAGRRSLEDPANRPAPGAKD